MINSKYYLLSLFLCVGQFAFAQSHPYQVKFSYQIEQQLAEEKIRPARAGLLYSLIGDYHNSVQFSDIPVSWGVDSLDVEEYALESALPKIIEAAREHQIVIISENHLRPQHRIFAAQIIAALSQIGYQHLGMETLASISNGYTLLDSTLNERGYPLSSPLTGTYTFEPQMGNLVRQAHQSGLNLFAYEKRQKVEGKDREEIQADNIIQYVEAYPDSKIIIFCGFYHAIESDRIKRGTAFHMAKYLKYKLGIDPLTIYQDNFTEKFIYNEHPSLGSLAVDEPSVFIDKSGEVAQLTQHIDIEVIHPKTAYRNNRPSWLYRDNGYKAVEPELDNMELDYPIIVEAYLADEENSVPVDRIEIKHPYDSKALVLNKGEYRIVVIDGVQKNEYQKTVN